MATKAFQKIYTKITQITKATCSLKASGVGYDELAMVNGKLAQVVKIMGDEVQGEKIRNVLIKTQGTNISNMNFKHNEIEEYFYSLIFEDKEGLNA